MANAKATTHGVGFGTAPVFFTAISTILGAILFLRFGFAVGSLGFWGAILIVVLGHMITLPTALAISEISTNTRVEGGGEYFIISRSFGLKIGSTIGIALFLSQAISVAFYIIAFTEAFEPFFNWWYATFEYELPRQAISIPALGLLALIILKRGANLGVKALYVVVGILFLALILFFAGKPIEAEEALRQPGNNFGFFNRDNFFVIFAICFPAFTGMTAGVGLSGDLKNPGKSIPLGTLGGTVAGMLVYLFIVWKMSVSASQADLMEHQLIMSHIAIGGAIIIPLGLAASTISSALGSVMVAPRTLQALAYDKIFPFRRFNLLMAKGKGKTREPFNAGIVSFVIAFLFVALGDVDVVAEIISMFFLITYGSLCLISFLNHFGAPPSYRPRFRSRWYFSLAGFLLSVWVMFMINPFYTIMAYVIIVILYLVIEHYNKDQKGLVNIFKGSLFQLNRKIQVYMQKNQSETDADEWRPAVVCISPHSLEREKVLDLMKWISYKHGFGTYFHYLEGYYSKQTYAESREIMKQLINLQIEENNAMYIDTMISPSYTSAIAQVIQAPSISGMENNMVLFEYDKNKPEEIHRILENIKLTKAGNFDVCIFASSTASVRFQNGIHVWIRPTDMTNTNLMILLGYIIMAHPDWQKGHIKIFSICAPGHTEETKQELEERIASGRLPITLTNIEIIASTGNQTISEIISTRSRNAALTIMGFRDEKIKHEGVHFFNSFHDIGDILFVNAAKSKEIK
ncbi:amino acid permease [Natronoflexus pectinivorans]|uniref:Amino acid transporter n=1 Tax=Natronoflexus pectinivorans TaxID=682526 RepID=A0A4R2GLG7_9BACT|nr:amino acid permease [Natronoflexus pectinivorans]TCO09158.1 amino acid transporter [Natronoflexus pectinivorans]